MLRFRDAVHLVSSAAPTRCCFYDGVRSSRRRALPPSLAAGAVRFAALGLVAALSACASGSEQERSGPDAAYQQLLALAKDQGASKEQLDALEKAGPDGVGFPAYSRAVNRSFDCMREAGIDVIGGAVTSTRGFPEIHYSYAPASGGLDEEAGQEVADRCLNENSSTIEMSYQNSKANLAAYESAIEKFRPALIKCLADRGVKADPNLPMRKLMELDPVQGIQSELGGDAPSEGVFSASPTAGPEPCVAELNFP